MAPNNTAYTQWSCHSGLANPVQIVSAPPSNGGPITVLGKPVMDLWTDPTGVIWLVDQKRDDRTPPTNKGQRSG